MMKILIVDDSLAMTAIVRRSVQSSGLDNLEIETAKSAADALECMPAFKPNLVITDWHMPKMSGLEMLQNMKQLGFAEVCVGFISSEINPGLIEESKRNGAKFFLNKPFKDADLWGQLKEIESTQKFHRPHSQPVQTAEFQDCLKSMMKTPFRLVEQKMETSDLSEKNILALYGAPSNSRPQVVAVMNINAAIIIGSAMLGMQPADAKSQFITGKPTDDVQGNAVKAFAVCAKIIHADSKESVSMSRQSIVAKDFPKLIEIMASKKPASHFRIDVPGYGSGRLAFFMI